MTAIRNPLRATFATAAAAVALSAAQFAGIDALATPYDAAPAAAAVVQLPRVVVTASRVEMAEVQQLPAVVVTASRRDLAQPVRLPTVVVTGRAEQATAALPRLGEAAAI